MGNDLILSRLLCTVCMCIWIWTKLKDQDNLNKDKQTEHMYNVSCFGLNQTILKWPQSFPKQKTTTNSERLMKVKVKHQLNNWEV